MKLFVVLLIASLSLAACTQLSPAGKKIDLISIEDSAHISLQHCHHIQDLKASSEEALRNAAALINADTVTVKTIHTGDLHYVTGMAYSCHSNSAKTQSDISPAAEFKQTPTNPSKATNTLSESQRKSRICSGKGGEWLNQQCILLIE